MGGDVCGDDGSRDGVGEVFGGDHGDGDGDGDGRVCGDGGGDDELFLHACM